MPKFLGVISLVVFSLLAVGCQEQLRANLAGTCKALNDIFAHYDAVAETGTISERRMQTVSVVRQQVDAMCISPETATTLTITGTAAQAYVALRAAFAEGGTLRSAQMGSMKLERLRRKLEETGYGH